MRKSEEENRQRDLRELEGKKIAHYSILLQAWVDTRMERDRTIVTLSSGAIGLLATILITVGIMRRDQIYLYGAAFVGFLSAALISLLIYQRNSAHLEEALRGSRQDDRLLAHYDKAQMASFIVGAILAAWIGVDSAVFRLNGENAMSDKAKTAPVRGLANDSLNGIRNLGPQELTKSLNGIARLSPSSSPTPSPSSGQAQVQTQNGTTQPSTTAAKPSTSK